MVNRLRILRITIGWSAIVLIAVGNVQMLAWVLNTWGGSFTVWGWIKAVSLEIAIIWTAHTLTQRIMYNQNGRRLKSYPVAPIKTMMFSLICLTVISATVNSIYYGMNSNNPTGVYFFDLTIAIILGISAPIMTAIITYSAGEEAALEAGVVEAERINSSRKKRKIKQKPEKLAYKNPNLNAVLRAVDREPPGTKPSNIQAVTGLSKTTVFNHLKTLERDQRIVKNNGRIYVRK